MRTFLEHSTTLTVSQFPTAAKTKAGERYLQQVVDAINSARQNGAIPNPVYTNIKDMGNRIIEQAIEKTEEIYDAVYRNEHQGKFTLWDLDSSIPYANTIAGKLKKAKSAKPQSDEDRAFLAWFIPRLTELEPLATGIVDLKGLAVKKLPKSAEEKAAEKEKFVAPLAKSESGRMVVAALTKMSDDLKHSYADSLTKFWFEVGSQFEALDKDEQERQRRAYGQVLGVRAAWIGGYREHMRMSDKAKEAFRAEARKVADDMQQAFVYKNKAKLVAILERAGALTTEPKVLNLHAARGIFEGEMRFEFASGASFIVRNKVVLKVNNYGTWFNQYPTTFHDVKMSDGSKMGSPSEERMNTVFA